MSNSDKVTEEEIELFNIDGTISSRMACGNCAHARRRYQMEKNLRFAEMYGFKEGRAKLTKTETV